ncbi:tryptophan biosynthesis modulator TrpM [Streptomyces purpurogeneiscleroticus]|uniref:tryptophan biosynthesis modulator TrpM n=1 Tax=Streptomyces purpurogeneiscleroticus TaxID=68259 RepID=UPI001CBEEC38|nr:tryptophan synthase subunit(beta) [Streptomyces purpurogeneiscleroticus]MBZ4016791.1 tryptophan synthase subunit(beta) [Streptomyces purpurogeneiscleroticus]
MTAARTQSPSPGLRPGTVGAARLPHAALGRGCRPRGCRAPARRIHGRRVRYHIGSEPGQINGRRWRRTAAPRAGSHA